jgi:hypothetical protein
VTILWHDYCSCWDLINIGIDVNDIPDEQASDLETEKYMETPRGKVEIANSWITQYFSLIRWNQTGGAPLICNDQTGERPRFYR